MVRWTMGCRWDSLLRITDREAEVLRGQERIQGHTARKSSHGLIPGPQVTLLTTPVMMTPQRRQVCISSSTPPPQGQRSGPLCASNSFQKGEVCRSPPLLVCHPIGIPKPYPSRAPAPWLLAGSNPGTSTSLDTLRVGGRALREIVSDHTLLLLGDRKPQGQVSVDGSSCSLCRCVWKAPTDEG